MSDADTPPRHDYPTIAAGLTWYCPQGHQCYTNPCEEVGTPECGSCGATMSTDPEAFYDVLGRIEDEGIARVASTSSPRSGS